MITTGIGLAVAKAVADWAIFSMVGVIFSAAVVSVVTKLPYVRRPHALKGITRPTVGIHC